MNTRSPYGPMVQQQQASAPQARPMQYQRPTPQQTPPREKDSGGGGIMSMMSDENSKKEIAQLESANEALTKALSSKAEYPDTTARSGGMQALGQQAVPPSHGEFPDEPAPADKVAAQNVAMLRAQQPGQPQPQAQAPGAPPPQQNPWGVKTSMPNMSDLDEAYARMGQGG